MDSAKETLSLEEVVHFLCFFCWFRFDSVQELGKQTNSLQENYPSVTLYELGHTLSNVGVLSSFILVLARDNLFTFFLLRFHKILIKRAWRIRWIFLLMPIAL